MRQVSTSSHQASDLFLPEFKPQGCLPVQLLKLIEVKAAFNLVLVKRQKLKNLCRATENNTVLFLFWFFFECITLGKITIEVNYNIIKYSVLTVTHCKNLAVRLQRVQAQIPCASSLPALLDPGSSPFEVSSN